MYLCVYGEGFGISLAFHCIINYFTYYTLSGYETGYSGTRSGISKRIPQRNTFYGAVPPLF